MKKLLVVVAVILSFGTLIFLACNKEGTPVFDSTAQRFNDLALTLVQEYNMYLEATEGSMLKDFKRGFLAKGTVTSDQFIDSDGDLTLALLFHEVDQNTGDKRIRFNVGLDNPMDFPTTLINSQVLFLGSQLVIRDSDGIDYNFHVEDDKVSLIRNAIEPIYIAVMNVSSEADARFGSCSCKCVSCPDPNTNCNTASCSCGCSNSSCSVTCRTGSNAVCKSSGGCF